jgi:hypothetical protein
MRQQQNNHHNYKKIERTEISIMSSAINAPITGSRRIRKFQSTTKFGIPRKPTW